MKKLHCPLCKSQNIQIIYKPKFLPKHVSFAYTKSPEFNQTFPVVRCRNCTHVFCHPIPSQIYKSYEDVVDTEYLRHAPARLENAKEIIKIIRRYTKSGKMLDIGCATGDFLEIAKKKKYETYGLELSGWAVKVARKRGLKIYNETIEAHAKKHAQTYDIITMWGVIEHFQYPFEELSYISKLLKPGGMLFLWTGDIDSWMSKILGRKWWYWQGQHIQYFSENSMNTLGEKVGIIPLTVHKYPFVMTYDLLQTALGRYPLLPFFAKLTKPLFMIKSHIVLRLSGEMFWVGKKK